MSEKDHRLYGKAEPSIMGRELAAKGKKVAASANKRKAAFKSWLDNRKGKA